MDWTYCAEVDWVAVLPSEGALQQHVVDVVTCAVVEVSHVEQFGLESLEVGLLF